MTQVQCFRSVPLSPSASLPPELMGFLNRQSPQALLVRGAPGTGKTILGIALLEAFPGRRIYVSSRTRTSQLHRDFPVLEPLRQSGQLSLVEMAMGDMGGLRAASRAVESAPRLVADLANQRLRSLLLPPEVLAAWSESSPTSPTLVVLDSWDAIVERFLGHAANTGESLPSREEVERIAIGQMAEGPVTVVFVVEHREAGQLEYLVNGIVTMEQQLVDNRLERWLRIDKLRGTRIGRASYPFSLDGGRLQCIEPMRMDALPPASHIDPEPQARSGYIWPGSNDYASTFGWLAAGKMTLIEFDQDVPIPAIRLLVGPMLNQTVAKGGRVFHLPPPGMHPAEVWGFYEGQTSREVFFRQVRIVSALSSDEAEEFGPAVLPLPSGTVEGYIPRIPEAAKFLREGASVEHPNLGVLSIGGMKSINALVPGTYTEDTMPGLALTYIHQSPLHAIMIGQVGEPLTKSVYAMAETRLRMQFRDGRVFLHGVNPWTPWIVLTQGDGRAPYHFLEVV